jgi:hypothetical protein
MNERQPRQHDDDYLNFIRSQRCCLCGTNEGVEAAHLRIGSIGDGKPPTGMGEKPSDRWTLPLCSKHHREQHSFCNELEWWSSYGIDPFSLAMRYHTRKP